MINQTAIANHLNASSLLEVCEWAKVLWVKALVAGKIVCRFVSKKIGSMNKIIANNPMEYLEAGHRLALELLSGVEFPEYTTEYVTPGLFLPPQIMYVVGDHKFSLADVESQRNNIDWDRVQYCGEGLAMIDQHTADQN